MEFEHILVENRGRIQYIIINREKKLNALNKFTLCELHEALTAAFANEHVGGIIITGAGTKAFVAGADIAEFDGQDASGGRQIATGPWKDCDSAVPTARIFQPSIRTHRTRERG